MKRDRIEHVLATRAPWQGFPAWMLACLVVAFVQSTWIADFAVVRPSLTAILIAHIGLRARRERLLPALIVLGGATALFTVESPAACVAAAVGIGLVLLVVRPFLFAEHVATRAIVIFATALVVVSLPTALRLPATRPELALEALGVAALSALVTAAVGVVADAALLRVGFCRRLGTARRLELAS